MNSGLLIVEHIYDTTVTKLWDALTKNEEIRKWYFQLAEFKPEVGFIFTFTGGKTGEFQYKHICEITEVIPRKKLAYSWRYDGFPGISYVSIELIEEGTRVRLKLTHSGLETFDHENPHFDLKNFQGGWNFILGQSLSNYFKK
jgi:uncharacterized protein YndB with AHSA1/START domain